ncbi:META domain-containing protein [Oceaniovalibus sp. ACAM 378]|jgi:heat shock protein HslJ|uniref:META domain-containing protein n=1 Tax=Oceaniovalibus sp. ACAM 378 TaxID=2599923 RepID=UPI0011DBC53D|nr:META domain-containing protein [Oceaniovalibus sp. ACAM 378]TYB90326.1 META domain-containing protein [Oceaniovalibus sp. ACAM 378]
MRYLLILAALAACSSDETVSGLVDSDTSYVLETLDGAAFTSRATIDFPGEGKVLGEAPCNRWSAGQTLDYPLIKIETILSTKRSCPDQAQETAYFAALERMKRIDSVGRVVILSDGKSGEMVFRAER